MGLPLPLGASPRSPQTSGASCGGQSRTWRHVRGRKRVRTETPVIRSTGIVFFWATLRMASGEGASERQHVFFLSGVSQEWTGGDWALRAGGHHPFGTPGHPLRSSGAPACRDGRVPPGSVAYLASFRETGARTILLPSSTGYQPLAVATSGAFPILGAALPYIGRRTPLYWGRKQDKEAPRALWSCGPAEGTVVGAGHAILEPSSSRILSLVKCIT